MQIRTKLTLSFFIITFLLLSSSLVFIYLNFRNFIYSEFYSTLRSRALMTVMMVEKSNPELSFSNNSNTSEVSLAEHENVIIYDFSLKKLFAIDNSINISNQILTHVINQKEHKFNIGNTNALGIIHTTSSGKKLILIATDKFMSEDLVKLRNIMISTFFLFLMIILLTGFYFSRQALKPINTTVKNLKNIFPNDLTKRLVIQTQNNDEISKLNGNINSLLDRIEESFNTQKAFLSNVSHEIRNPLASIISSIQLKLSRNRSIEEYVDCLTSIHDDAKEMEHTLIQLMELARLSEDSTTTKFTEVRLDEVIWQTKAAIRKDYADASFIFDTTQFPHESESLKIWANEGLIKMALYNLFENACKFSPDHIAHLKIFINNEKQICVEIKDTAPVILETEKEIIFKPFYRRNITNKIKGTGIGLTLVARILKLHNAQIKITNDGEIGNVFTISFLGSENSN